MNLYVYDHCPFCVKARMIFGLTQTPLQLHFIANDDEATPIGMIGQKMLPILETGDKQYLPESMDIVHYVDNLQNHSIFEANPSPAIQNWVQETFPILHKLVMPRTVLYPFAEFPTESSRQYYQNKKEDYVGPFDENIAKTAEYLPLIEDKLQQLSDLMASENFIHTALSEDDIHVFAMLRSLSLTRGIHYPEKVKNYMVNMAAKSQVPLLWDNAI